MKVDTGAIQSHLDQEVTTLAWCWKATRRDGTLFGFTSHDQNLVIDGLTYYAETGLNATNAQAKVGTSVDNLEVGGMLDSTTITEEDLRSGLWDGCEIKVFIVNYKNTVQQLIVQVGTLGDVTVKKLQFIAEMRSLAQFLQNTIGRIITKRCDATFGDSKCGINLVNHTRSDSIAILLTPTTFVSSVDLTTQITNYINDPTEKLIMNGDDFTDLLGNTVTASTIPPTIDLVNFKTSPGSILFNAADSTFLEVAHSPSFNISNNNFTIEASIRLSTHSSTGYYAILTKDGALAVGNNEYSVFLTGTANVSTTSLSLKLYNSVGNSYIDTILNYTFALNTTYDIAISKVGSTVYFHINGTYLAATINGTNANAPLVTTIPLVIGAFPSPRINHYFNGNIDNIRMTISASKYTTSNYVPNTTSRSITQLPVITPKITPFGKLTWLTGLNTGNSMEIKSLTSGNNIALVLPMPNDIQVGDTFSISSGCDKNFTSTTGCSSFSNQTNFRGFPFIPGIDAVMEYPDAH